MSVQNFIAEVWDAAIMEALYAAHIFTQPLFVNRNYEGEIRSQGDTVHITGIEPVGIADYKRYQDIKFEELDTNTRTMEIDQAKYFALAIDDIDEWQAKGDLMAPSMREAGYKMAGAVDGFVADKMARSVDPRNVVEVEALTGDEAAKGKAVRHAFVQLRTKAKRNNLPAGQLWAAVTPEVYAILLEDPHFIEADKRGSSSIVEGNGVVGTIYGFNIVESVHTPISEDGAVHHILSGNNTAFSFAEALTKTEALRLQNTFGDGIRGLHVYGGKVIRPEGLYRVDVGGMDPIDPTVTFRDSAWVDEDRKPSRFPRVMAPSHVSTPKPGAGEVDTAPADGVSDSPST